MYAVEASPDLINTVTDAVVAEVTAWQTRPLERHLRCRRRVDGCIRSYFSTRCA